MTTYLLVHGAFITDWIWSELARRLEQRGHRVELANLPSTGTDPSALGDLAADAAEVRRMLDAAGSEVVLVGHSYGGTVITEVADHPAVRHSVYVCALWPRPGQTVAELPGGGPLPSWMVARDDGTVQVTDDLSVAREGLCADLDAERAAEVHRQFVLSAQSIFTVPSSAPPRPHQTTYVICEHDNAIPADAQEAMANSADHVVRLASAHIPMLSAPDELATVLDAVSGSPDRSSAVDEATLHRLLGNFVTDLGGSFHAISAVIGDRLGLYRSLLAVMPASPGEVAAHAGVGERYVREWLGGQAAGGYVTYDPASERFSLTNEQAFALAAPDGMQIAAAFHLSVAAAKNVERLTDAVRTNGGFGWHEHDPALFEGTERFFRPGYVANLVSNWIPALDGVAEKLRNGAQVADIGCGHGASTLLLAASYPSSQVVGFDYHGPSIEQARKRAADAGLASRVSFTVAAAADFPGTDYDLAAIFDALHDMPDPLGAAKHIRESLKPDGTLLLVEPYAHDKLEDNFNPVGRLYYGASTVLCVAHSMTEEPRTALGAQAGEARLTEILRAAGFTRVRRATETPFNLILEAKP